MRRLFIGIVAASACLVSFDRAEAACGAKEQPCLVKNGGYRIVLPNGPGPHPAVVWLYGSTGKSKQLLSQEFQVRAFTERGYAFIVPIARNVRYNVGVDSGWSLRHSPAIKPRNDVQFVRDVLSDAQTRYRINRKKVLIIGQSRGAHLAWEIACHAPGTATAYAPHAGGYIGPLPKKCRGPARVIHTHGRNDPIVPFRPKKKRRSGRIVTQPPEVVLATMARTNGCTSRRKPERFRDYERIAWQGCAGGTEATLLVHNSGHGWPLSFPSTVLDWFEEGTGRPRTGVAGTANPKFKSVGSRLPGAKKSSRFKKAKTYED